MALLSGRALKDKRAPAQGLPRSIPLIRISREISLTRLWAGTPLWARLLTLCSPTRAVRTSSARQRLASPTTSSFGTTFTAKRKPLYATRPLSGALKCCPTYKNPPESLLQPPVEVSTTSNATTLSINATDGVETRIPQQTALASSKGTYSRPRSPGHRKSCSTNEPMTRDPLPSQGAGTTKRNTSKTPTSRASTLSAP